MTLRPSTFLGVVAVSALAACSSAPGRAGPIERCSARGERVLAAGPLARVFAFRGSVYGCLERSGRRFLLGTTSTCVRSALVGPAAVANVLIAYGVETCGVDTGTATVEIRDLAHGGRVSRSAAAITRAAAPESYASVDSIALGRSGAVAWIATSSSIVRHDVDREVHAIGGSGGRDRLLDSGAGIAARSLRLHGSRLTWRHGTRTRSAGLR